MKPLFLLVFSLLILKSPLLNAAACCGGGFASPSVIVGDDKAQLATTISRGEIVSDVYTDGLWRQRSESEITQTLRLEGAHLLSDRTQAGFSLPIISRSRAQETSQGYGDINSSLAYEYLPDWDYNPWRPKGIGFVQLTWPTGKSIYESDNVYGLDARGRGFWALGLGTLLSKNWNHWDGEVSMEAHRSFNKTVKINQQSETLQPGWGSNATLGAGYNTADYRFGGAVTWSQEDPVDLVGDFNSSGTQQKFATGTLSASTMYNEDWSGTLSYADQTLFGDPINTSLGRTVSLQLQRRWAR